MDSNCDGSLTDSDDEFIELVNADKDEHNLSGISISRIRSMPPRPPSAPSSRTGRGTPSAATS